MQYTIGIQNTGNVAAKNVDVNVPTLEALECGTLARPFVLGVGKNATCRASYRVTHIDQQQGGGKVHSIQVTSDGSTVPAISVTVAMAYGCDTCSACIADFAGVMRNYLALAGNATNVAKGMGAFCASTKRSPVTCQELQSYINGSTAGRAGLRAGVICQRLKECVVGNDTSTQLPGNCISPTAQATNLQGQPINGTVDLCTVQGVASGDLLPNFNQAMGEEAEMESLCCPKIVSSLRTCKVYCICMWRPHKRRCIL